LEPAYRELRGLVDRGVLGDPYWFSLIPTGPDRYHPSLGGNPYGLGAFYSPDSGGILFDYPYAPTQIVTLLGSCKSVMGMAKISVPQRAIVPESAYDSFLEAATDPEYTNYWDVVVDLPRTEQVTMGAADNVFSLYEMASGATGCFHAGRLFHPILPGAPGGSLQIFGTAGNLIFDGGHFASIISSKRDLLPHIAADGWYHMPYQGDRTKAVWPKPVPGAFNYYHASAQHLLDCILDDRDPIVNVEWGRHITEMMIGAIESSRTGRRYEMTTTAPI
jgi:predicted dehydrogenase